MRFTSSHSLCFRLTVRTKREAIIHYANGNRSDLYHNGNDFRFIHAEAIVIKICRGFYVCARIPPSYVAFRCANTKAVVPSTVFVLLWPYPLPLHHWTIRKKMCFYCSVGSLLFHYSSAAIHHFFCIPCDDKQQRFHFI